MKIITWNIDFKTSKDGLFEFINREVSPDLLLLQECKTVPQDYKYTVGERIGGSRQWGSVILSNKFALQPLELINHQGWVVGANTSIANQNVLIFSLHAKLKDIGHYVAPHLKNIFEEIMKVKKPSDELIVGGDFNAARLYDDV